MFLLGGIAWAMIASGVFIAGSFLLFTPVDQEPTPRTPPDEETPL